MPNARADALPASVVAASRRGRAAGYRAVLAGLARALPHPRRGPGLVFAHPGTPGPGPDAARQRVTAFRGVAAAAAPAAAAATALLRSRGGRPSRAAPHRGGPGRLLRPPGLPPVPRAPRPALAALPPRHRPRHASAPGSGVPRPDGRSRKNPPTIEVKP